MYILSFPRHGQMIYMGAAAGELDSPVELVSLDLVLKPLCHTVSAALLREGLKPLSHTVSAALLREGGGGAACLLR